MNSFHPSDVELAEYASGSSDWAVGICIATHLHFCRECREKVMKLNALGAHCMEVESSKSEMPENGFNKTLERIKQLEANKGEKETAAVQERGYNKLQLPHVLRKIIKNPKDLKWSRISPSLKEAKLVTEQNKYQVSLHKIKKGGKSAEHDHRGREIVCVIDGSFSDKDGTYLPGDYVVRNPGDTHRPMATSDKDCICLSIVEAPVKVSGILGLFVNPFLRITPA